MRRPSPRSAPRSSTRSSSRASPRSSGRSSPRSSPRSSTLPSAVLWDLDGTLVDTEPYWIALEHELVAAYGGTWSDEHAKAIVGNDLLVSGAYIRDHGPVPLTAEEITARLVAGVVARVREGVPWRPGAVDLLSALGAAGVPCGLVTMSYRSITDAVLATLPAGTFRAVVTGDEVRHGKPHPEPYLTAADLVGVPAEHCIAIEDSATGAASAEAAGCRVLVVPHVVDVPPGPLRTLRDSLEGLDPLTLAALVPPAPRRH